MVGEEARVFGEVQGKIIREHHCRAQYKLFPRMGVILSDQNQNDGDQCRQMTMGDKNYL